MRLCKQLMNAFQNNFWCEYTCWPSFLSPVLYGNSWSTLRIYGAFVKKLHALVPKYGWLRKVHWKMIYSTSPSFPVSFLFCLVSISACRDKSKAREKWKLQAFWDMIGWIFVSLQGCLEHGTTWSIRHAWFRYSVYFFWLRHPALPAWF